jgi:transglutaminase-like putative cysteine protease
MKPSSRPPFPWALALLYLWAFLSYAFMSGFHPLAVLMLPLAGVAFWQRERWPLSRKSGGIALGLSILLTVGASQTAKDSGYLLGIGSLSFAVFAASTLLTFTVLRSAEETRLAIPGLCGFLLVTSSMSTNLMMVALTALPGALLLVLSLRAGQSLPLSPRLLPPLLVIALLTMALSVTARWSESRLSYLMHLFSMIPASGIRFPPTSQLDSLQRNNFSDVVVLRIYGDEAPPYLIGRTFTTYDERFWQWKPNKQEIHSVAEVASPVDGRPLGVFPNRPEDSKPRLEMPVVVEFPDGGSGFTFYTPREFSALATDLERLHRYSDGLWQVLALDKFSGYYALYPYPNGWVRQDPPEPLSEAERTQHLELSPAVTPEVARLAEEVAGRYPEPAEKAKRITAFFQTQFEYGYDFPFESPRTALEEFLIKRPPAHCEFFATAAALMLRAQGVPTRYINGFVVQERSYDNEYFVVRLKHAHAWLEAYLPGQGWTTFDPTPPGVLNDPNSPNDSRLRAVLEYLSNSWRQLISWFRMSPADMVASVKRFFTSSSSHNALTLLGLGFAAWGLKRWWTTRRRRPLAEPQTTFFAGRHERLTPLLEQLMSSVFPPDWRRHSWETPWQWCERLSGSSLDPALQDRLRAALQRYSAARYGEQFEPAELLALERELTELRCGFEGKSLEARERPQG